MADTITTAAERIEALRREREDLIAARATTRDIAVMVRLNKRLAEVNRRLGL